MNPWKEKCDQAIKDWQATGRAGWLLFTAESMEAADYIKTYMELVDVRAVVAIMVGNRVCLIDKSNE